jgi:hypothetical protein
MRAPYDRRKSVKEMKINIGTVRLAMQASFSTLENRLGDRFISQPITPALREEIASWVDGWVSDMIAQGDIAERIRDDLRKFIMGTIRLGR